MGAGHELVFGQTGTGKSSLLRYKIIPPAIAAEEEVILFDPFGERWPDGVWATSDRAAFHKRVWERTECLVIHDEVSEAGKVDRALEKLAVQGRHLGHRCIFSAQRPQMISTTVRGQCERGTIFHLVPKDAEFLADFEFGDERLYLVSKLKPLEYITTDRQGNIHKGKIVFPKESEIES